jgi:hypothetical protein
MTARSIPAHPQFETESEREVWNRLLERAPDGWTILANVRLTNESKDHEFDLVVIMPTVGVVVAEVKGGSVTVDDAGVWRTTFAKGSRVIHPVDQARDGKHALWRYVRSDPRWKNSSRTRVRFGHTVIVPYTDLHADFATSPAGFTTSSRSRKAAIGRRPLTTATSSSRSSRAATSHSASCSRRHRTGRRGPTDSPWSRRRSSR